MIVKYDPPYQYTAEEVLQLLSDCANLNELRISSEGVPIHGLKNILSYYLAGRSIAIVPNAQTITVAYCKKGKTIVRQGRHTFSLEQMNEMNCIYYRFYQES